MHTNILRESDRAAILGHQSQGGERDLQIRALGREDNVGETLSPCGAAADARAVEREDKDFAVVDDGAEELEGRGEAGEEVELFLRGVGVGFGGTVGFSWGSQLGLQSPNTCTSFCPFCIEGVVEERQD